MSCAETLRFIRRVRRDGWTATFTGAGHIRLVHPDGAFPVYGAGSPSDQRAFRNLEATMRRSLREGAERRKTKGHAL